ncbi:MAG: C4-dicarboxylate TRAP transporter substrate-binding protein [Alphaproteobacteria bacterium]
MTAPIRIAGTSGALAAITLAAGLAMAPSAGAETAKITFVSGYPPAAAWVGQFVETFAVEADKALAGGADKIEWNMAHSGQIVKPGGELDAIKDGLAEIGIVVYPLGAPQMPAHNISYYTPFVTPNIILASKILDQVAGEFPKMGRALDPFNQTLLCSTGTVDSYQILSRKPINTLDDLKGMKIGGAGPNLQWIEGFGSVGVSSNMATVYNSMQTGVIEAMLLDGGNGMTVRIYEVAPYLVKADMGAGVAFGLSINNDAMKRLPKSVQAAITKVAPGYCQKTAEVGTANSVKADDVWKEKGKGIIVISPEERRKWATTMPNVAQQWADRLEAQGVPGRAILANYMDKMRAAKQPIARQWDKE